LPQVKTLVPPQCIPAEPQPPALLCMGTLGIRNFRALVMCAEVGPLALSIAELGLVVAPVLVPMGMLVVLVVLDLCNFH
jgi:hypothetical protein